MRAFTALALIAILSSCAHQQREPANIVEKHYYDSRSIICSYAFSLPTAEDKQSRLIVAQMGSKAFSFDQGLAVSAFNSFSKDIVEKNFVLEVDQPGILSSLNPSQLAASEAWVVEPAGALSVRRLKLNYLWTSDQYASCYVRAIEEFIAKRGNHHIELFGYYTGGEIFVRLLSQLAKKPELFALVDKVYLSGALLEDAKPMLNRQIDKFNQQAKGKTHIYRESSVDPVTQKRVTKTITEPVAPRNFEKIWNDVQHITPVESSIERLRMADADFSNFYIQALNVAGPAGKALLALPLDGKKVFIYQGLLDWHANPIYVNELERKANTSHKTNFIFRYYDAGHNLLDHSKYQRDLAVDLMNPVQVP